MKTIFLTLSLLLSFSILSSDNYCYDVAIKWQKQLHLLAKEQLGKDPIVKEVLSYSVVKKVLELDNIHETYEFIVKAENAAGDKWFWTYEVGIEVWLYAGGSVRFCDVFTAKFNP